jgi:hypothetical protein
MRWVLRLFNFLVAILLLGILGLTGWLAFVRPDLLPLFSAHAAKIVCSNVFIAGLTDAATGAVASVKTKRTEP